MHSFVPPLYLHAAMIVPFLGHYKYTVLFLGLFFGGDTALLVGIYFSVIGVMALWYVVVLTLAASLLADFVWYWVGIAISYKQLKQLPYFRTHKHYITLLEKFLDKHALKALFYSKFVYGTRMIVQIICGIHGVDIFEYFLVNTVGTLMWVSIFLAIGNTISANLRTFRHVAHGIELTFLFLILVIIAINILVKRTFIRQLQKEE